MGEYTGDDEYALLAKSGVIQSLDWMWLGVDGVIRYAGDEGSIG